MISHRHSSYLKMLRRVRVGTWTHVVTLDGQLLCQAERIKTPKPRPKGVVAGCSHILKANFSLNGRDYELLGHSVYILQTNIAMALAIDQMKEEGK